MKHLLWIFITTALFISCNKDDVENDETSTIKITISNVKYSPTTEHVDRIVAGSYFIQPIFKRDIASAPWDGNECTITLPKPNKADLRNIMEYLITQSPTIHVSDKSAMFLDINAELKAYKGEHCVGYFQHASDSGILSFFYADRDFNINGVIDIPATGDNDEDIHTVFDLKFKKGWNKVRKSKVITDTQSQAFGTWSFYELN